MFGKQLLLLIIVMCHAMQALAQTAVLTGKVTDGASGEALPAVSVSLRNKGKTTVLKFTRTGSDGSYALPFDGQADGRELVFSMMGFESKSISLAVGRNEYDAVMDEKATKLKEVIVKAPPISMKGDTILYNVAKYAGAHDRTIGDVLKHMPGIDVADNGAISYNGQQINSFYIEGKDMLGGQYGLATNTVHQEDVATVEVMENHQPIRALEDVSFSQSPAINLRLKNRARSHWAGTAKASTGFSPALWHGELSLMRFAKSVQTLNTYKADNTGEDISRQLTDLSLDDMRGGFGTNYSLRTFVDVNPARLAQLDGRRSRFNRTHMVSTNNLLGLSKNYDLAVNASYVDNTLEADNGSTTTYMFNDGSAITTADGLHDRLDRNILDAGITLRANLRTMFLENKLKANLQWNSSAKGVTGTYPNTSAGYLSHRQFTDRLQLIRRIGRKVVELRSFNSYQEKPQTLTVMRGDGQVQHQSVRSSAFFTDTYTSLGFVMSPFTVSATCGFTGLLRSMESLAVGLPDSLGTVGNNVGMNYWRVYAAPELEFRNNKVVATLRVPLAYTFYRFTDNLSDADKNCNKPRLSVALNAEYNVTGEIKVSVTGTYNQADVDEQSFFGGLVMSDYRNLYTGLVNFDNGSSATARLGVSYEKPLNAFFSRFDFSYTWTGTPWTGTRTFVGDYIVNGYTQADGRSRSMNVTGRVSQGIDAIKATLTLVAGYNSVRSYMYQNTVRTDYRTSAVTLSPRIKATPVSWLTLEYRLDYDYTRLEMLSSEAHYGLNNLSQALTFRLEPDKAWRASATVEHYYNEMAGGTSRHTVLVDVGLTRVFKRFEIDLTATNLLNRKDFSYTVYDGVSRVARSFRIRPRNVMLGVYFIF